MLRGFRLPARPVAPALLRGFSLALALAFVLACAACAPRVELPRYDDAGADFAAFRSRFSEPFALDGSLALRASLLYSTPKRSNRTDVQIFGDYGRPLRLDVRAGFGTMLALMREDKAGLLAYYPEQKKAYAHMDPVTGAQLLGLPFPFALRDLALVLSGHFGTLVPVDRAPASIRQTSAGGYAFAYPAGPVRLLELDPHGRPLRLEGVLSPYFRTQAEREGERPVPKGPRTWAITFSDYPEDDGDPEGPARSLALALPGDESALLRVKSLVHGQPELSARQILTLSLPAGTGFMALDRQTAPPPGVSEIITGGSENEHAQPQGKAHG